MAGSPRNSLGNVRSDMDITYPEHLSRLHRHSLLAEYPKCLRKEKNTRNRRGIRYRTQPVTFGEIQEVDEESMVIESPGSDDNNHSMSASNSTSNLNLDFYRFSKALGPKRKKPNPADVDMLPAKMDMLDQTNGEDSSVKALRSKPLEQLRWTDSSREGSV